MKNILLYITITLIVLVMIDLVKAQDTLVYKSKTTELTENYKKSLQAIYDHVGFKEDWVIAPIDDCTDKFWNTDGEIVYYANSEEEFKTEKGNFYSDDVYKQKFYDKWIYEGKDFTMIFCDPHVDGMKWFRVFDNKKKLSKNSLNSNKNKN